MDKILERHPAFTPRHGASRVLSTLALLTGLLSLPPTTAATTLGVGAGLSATPEPSFTSHVAAPTGTGFALGRLRVGLRVEPGCAVALPQTGELAQVRLQCNDNTVWLGHLVPQRATEPMVGRRESTAFIPLRFERQPDGFSPYFEDQSIVNTPMPTPWPNVRFNLDY
ncbi:MAG TPA: hypothetical protein VMR43_02100 [Variovorax sp.]|nr:hypothetical protein [Variovorax sp.]